MGSSLSAPASIPCRRAHLCLRSRREPRQARAATTRQARGSDALHRTYADAGGTVTTSFVTDAFTADQLLADPGGVAVIVHAGRDNYANVPHRYRTVSTVSGPDAATLATGDAGARYACGVVELRPLFVPTGYWMAAADGGGGDAGARFACGVVAASAASR